MTDSQPAADVAMADTYGMASEPAIDMADVADDPAQMTTEAVAKPKRKVPLERVLVVQLVEVMQITDISIIEQSFSATFYIELRFNGGALDEDLSKDGDAFPIVDGRPTFLPPAGWYLAQFDFNNAKRFSQIDSLCRHVGDDIVLAMRFEGTFLECMELEEFPFDAQELTISLAINCRTTGMIPVALALDGNTVSRNMVEDRHFTLRNEWDLQSKMHLGLRLVGTEGRMFPTIDITAIVDRKPYYYLVNIAFPMALFALMGNFQFTLPRYATADRFNVCFSLLLTVVAFKFSISTMMPTVSYLTTLDQFSLACAACVVLACFEAGMQGALLMYSVDQFFVGDEAGTDDEEWGEDGFSARMRARGLLQRGGGMPSQTTEEEMLWSMSRLPWVRHLDILALIINVIVMAVIVILFYRSSRGERANNRRHNAGPNPSEQGCGKDDAPIGGGAPSSLALV